MQHIKEMEITNNQIGIRTNYTSSLHGNRNGHHNAELKCQVIAIGKHEQHKPH
jgi:hypothetical protein